MSYKNPPFDLTPFMAEKCRQIAYILGLLEGAKLVPNPIKLRKESQIKTIQSSLAIEGNKLTLEQVTELLEGKKVVGPKKDILEVTNAIEVYKDLQTWNALSLKSLKKAHYVLMNGLIPDQGQWRTKDVGIFKGKEIAHVAPPAKMVPQLMEDLVAYIKDTKEFPWLIKGCFFHYELEFIHPFSDGNGRIGRLWQQVILMKENPTFEYVSVESMIRNDQSNYYKTLSMCDKKGDSTLFIEYSLNQILAALNTYFKDFEVRRKMTVNERLQYVKEKFKDKRFQRKEYIQAIRDISTATASRDLEYGFINNILLKFGNKKLTEYQFKRLT